MSANEATQVFEHDRLVDILARRDSVNELLTGHILTGQNLLFECSLSLGQVLDKVVLVFLPIQRKEILNLGFEVSDVVHARGDIVLAAEVSGRLTRSEFAKVEQLARVTS